MKIMYTLLLVDKLLPKIRFIQDVKTKSIVLCNTMREATKVRDISGPKALAMVANVDKSRYNYYWMQCPNKNLEIRKREFSRELRVIKYASSVLDLTLIPYLAEVDGSKALGIFVVNSLSHKAVDVTIQRNRCSCIESTSTVCQLIDSDTEFLMYDNAIKWLSSLTS